MFTGRIIYTAFPLETQYAKTPEVCGLTLEDAMRAADERFATVRELGSLIIILDGKGREACMRPAAGDLWYFSSGRREPRFWPQGSTKLDQELAMQTTANIFGDQGIFAEGDDDE